ncbi:MAG: M50 family metallopeptidase [Oscillospiraceae bacterium]|jgi:regulator of sigma E protease
MSIIVAILVFGLIIFIHELGHFMVAKACNVKINEFAIGMGPRLFKIQKGETIYSIRAFPIGGFVAMEGEDETSSHERSLNNKPISQRIAISAAGAIMNFILGFIAVVIMVNLKTGDSEPLIFTSRISGFSENSLSQQSGLQVNDEILKINGKGILSDIDLTYLLQTDSDGVYSFQVLRNGEKLDIENVQLESRTFSDGTKGYTIDFHIFGEKKSFINAAAYSFKKTISFGRMVWMSLGDIVTGNFKLNQLSGPVGIVSAIDTVIETEQGESFANTIYSLLVLLTMITVNLGVFNLLPIPALDGGRIVFLIIEAIRGKPIKPEHEGLVHFVSFIVLILLLLLVTFNDIKKFF